MERQLRSVESERLAIELRISILAYENTIPGSGQDPENVGTVSVL